LAAVLSVTFILPGCGLNRDGKEIPKEWRSGFKGKTLGEIEKTIGAPSESSPSKQFQHWVQPNPSGFKLLKLTCPLECGKNEIPVEAFFMAYKNGEGKPYYFVQLD
jgi:hypothetical protein